LLLGLGGSSTGAGNNGVWGKGVGASGVPRSISSNGVPRMPPRHGSGASLSSFVNDAGGGDFSALDATIGGGTLELDGGDEVLEVEGEWVGVKKREEQDGLPPKTTPQTKLTSTTTRHPSPLKRSSSTISQTKSDSSVSLTYPKSTRSSRSRSRSRSRNMRGESSMRMRSLGAAAAFAVEGEGGDGKGRVRGFSVGEEFGALAAMAVEPMIVPLSDVISVDQEVPSSSSRSRTSSVGSDFFSSQASDTGSSTPLSPPPPSNSLHGKSALYRIFLHTSSNGYIEFSFDNPNSHDILMAYLAAHLKPNQIPHKTENNAPVGGALQTMVLTPSKTEHRAPSSLSSTPRLLRTNSSSSCTLEKLQTKIINQRLQQESTPLEKVKENVASWMSSIVDCACCQDTTVAPDPDDKSTIEGRHSMKSSGIYANSIGKHNVSPASAKLKSRGIGGLSFEESSMGTSGSGSPKLTVE